MRIGLDMSVARTGGGSNIFSTYGLATKFTMPEYWVAGVQYSPLSTMPGYTFTRTGSQGAIDASSAVAFFAANTPAINSAGYHAYDALTNNLLNAGGAGTLSTQNVTTTATPYTLAFIGTGTVTLSGTSTAGPLVGTGASNQVSLNFTPTAGTLTLTVTGSVTYAVLVGGSLTAPSVPIIATAGATASIGTSALVVNDTLADVDQLFMAKVTFTSNSGAGQVVAENFLDGANRFGWDQATNSVRGYWSNAGIFGTVYVAITLGETVTLVNRRLSGQWRFGLIRAGALTWFQAADTAPMVMATKYTPGNYVSGNLPFLGRVHAGARKVGAFTTDQSVLDAAAVL